MSEIIQGLWIGDELSIMEQLSIQSFLKNNHTYHLYAYSDIKNVPQGAIVKDANHVLPESNVFTYKVGEGNGSYAGFANFFRYRLLLMHGGWWADTDVICLRPFNFDRQYVFASEWKDDSRTSVIASSGIIKVPRRDDFAKYCDKFCQSQNPAVLKWGLTGPALVQAAIDEFNLNSYLQPPEIFSPVAYTRVSDLVCGDANLESSIGQSYGIHLWNEMWRRSSIDKNMTFPKSCLYEKLKSKYL